MPWLRMGGKASNSLLSAAAGSVRERTSTPPTPLQAAITAAGCSGRKPRRARWLCSRWSAKALGRISAAAVRCAASQARSAGVAGSSPVRCGSASTAAPSSATAGRPTAAPVPSSTPTSPAPGPQAAAPNPAEAIATQNTLRIAALPEIVRCLGPMIASPRTESDPFRPAAPSRRRSKLRPPARFAAASILPGGRSCPGPDPARVRS